MRAIKNYRTGPLLELPTRAVAICQKSGLLLLVLLKGCIKQR